MAKQRITADSDRHQSADAEMAQRRRATEAFVELSRELSGSSDGEGWAREKLYEEHSA